MIFSITFYVDLVIQLKLYPKIKICSKNCYLFIYQNREVRANLVENISQFKFCLKLLDEICFGSADEISLNDLTVENLPNLR